MNTVIKPSKSIEVRSAGAKGRGIFATQPIKVGSIIEIAPAILLDNDDTSLVGMTNLANYTFGLTNDSDNRSVIALGYSSLFNHSEKPNADYLVTTKTVVIKAIKKIAANEEITIDYGWGDEFTGEWEA